MSNELLDHINKCLSQSKLQKKIDLNNSKYNSLELAAFMSIIFHEKVTSKKVSYILDLALRKIKNKLEMNKELKYYMLEELSEM